MSNKYRSIETGKLISTTALTKKGTVIEAEVVGISQKMRKGKVVHEVEYVSKTTTAPGVAYKKIVDESVFALIGRIGVKLILLDYEIKGCYDHNVEPPETAAPPVKVKVTPPSKGEPGRGTNRIPLNR